MTSDTGDKGSGPKKAPSGSRRPAPTIELKATELASEPIAHEQEAAGETLKPAAADTGVKTDLPPPRPDIESGGIPPRGPGKSARKIWDQFPGGLPLPLIGVAVTAGIVFFLLGLAAANLFVGREVAADARLERTQTTDDLSERIAKIETALAAPRAPDSAVIGRMSAAEAAAKLATENAAVQQRRTEELAALLRETRSRSDSAIAAAEAVQKGSGVGTPDVARGDVDALNNRIAALEQALKTSETERRAAGAADDQKNRLAVVSSVLLGTVERGAPFTAELAAARSLAPNAITLAPLEPFAASGVPSAQVLSRELSALIPAMSKAAGNVAQQDGSILEKLQANAERLVRIRPVGDVSGDQPVNVIARIEAKAARADITGALEELSNLPAPVRAPAGDWIKKAEARNAALAAAKQFSIGSLAAIGKPKT